jgi:hypothetical protein
MRKTGTSYYINKVPNIKKGFDSTESIEEMTQQYKDWKETIKNYSISDTALKENHPRIWQKLTTGATLNEDEIKNITNEFYRISTEKYNETLAIKEYELE